VIGLCGKPHGVNYAPSTPLRNGVRSYFDSSPRVSRWTCLPRPSPTCLTFS